jgi:hypothetical protein
VFTHSWPWKIPAHSFDLIFLFPPFNFLDNIFPSFNHAFLHGCPASVSLQEKKRQAALMLMSPGLVMATRIVPRKAIDLLESTVQKWTSHEYWARRGGGLE